MLSDDNPLAADIITALRHRFRLVLIDEFQDTDDAQWEVFSRVFNMAAIAAEQRQAGNPRPFLAMILVGDPKQAIYRFRGADIAAYLKAIADPELVKYDMRRNFRSDPSLIQTLNRLFGAPPGQSVADQGFRFGSDRISYVQVEAASGGSGRGLMIDGEDELAKPLQLGFVTSSGSKSPPVAELRSCIAEDAVNHVVKLLDDGSIEEEKNGVLGSRPIRPRDICILVRTHGDAEPLVEALQARTIPVVKSRLGSVTESPAAEQLRIFLTALSTPNDLRRVRAAALGWFVEFTAADVLDDAKVVELAERCRVWSELLVDQGLVGLFQVLRADPTVVTRLSAAPDAERRLTDLEHLVELLHRRTGAVRLSASSVLRHFEDLLGDPGDDDEHLRRIDSDADAIEITTIHASKGLEYPIVLVPFPKAPRSDSVSTYTHAGRRYVDSAPDVNWEDGGLDREARKLLAYREVEADELRLMYVAFTRAKYQLLVWWASSRGMNKSPLARLLFGDHVDASIETKVPEGDALAARFQSIAQHVGPQLVNLRALSAAGVKPLMPRGDRTVTLEEGAAQPFPGHASGRWWFRRWSFSTLASGLHDDQDHHAGGSDEGIGEASQDYRVGQSDTAESLGSYEKTGLFGMPASAEFGSLVHEVLEVVDFQSPTLQDDLRSAIELHGALRLRGIDVDELAAGLVAVLRTPLAPLLPSRGLVDVQAVDQLAEMAFNFRLAVGDRGASAQAIALAAASDPESPFAGYFQGLASHWGSGQDQAIGGLLTGSIDLTLRDAESGRYYVVDYKSNRLSLSGDPLDHRAYGHTSMRLAMESHHYPLQALLYCVALHGFLKSRLEKYDIDRHLGGAGYFFLRGMVGPSTPANSDGTNGVFAWRPSSEVIIEVDRILRGAT